MGKNDQVDESKLPSEQKTAQIDELFNEVKNKPNTEEEFIEQMIFWGRLQMAGAAGGASSHPCLGPVPVGEELDEKAIEKHRDPGILLICGILAIKACTKFKLALPGRPAKNGEIKFEDWFNAMAKKLGKEERYERLIFEP